MRKLLCALVLALCIVPVTFAQEEREAWRIAHHLIEIDIKVNSERENLLKVSSTANPHERERVTLALDAVERMQEGFGLIAELGVLYVQMETPNDRKEILGSIRNHKAGVLPMAQDAVEKINLALSRIRTPALAIDLGKILDYIQATVKELEIWNP